VGLWGRRGRLGLRVGWIVERVGSVVLLWMMVPGVVRLGWRAVCLLTRGGGMGG